MNIYPNGIIGLFQMGKLFNYIYLSTMPEELVTWFDKSIESDIEYVKSEQYEKMKADITTLKDMRSNTFTASLKRWCKARGYKFNPHKGGGRDFRHDNDYVIVKK